MSSPLTGGVGTYLSCTYLRKPGRGVEFEWSNTIVRTVRLASIYQPQIGGKFTTTPGGQTNILFYGCVTFGLNLPTPNWGQIHHDPWWANQHIILWLCGLQHRWLKTSPRNHKIWHGTEFAPNQKVGLKTHAVMNLLMKFQNNFQNNFQNLIE